MRIAMLLLACVAQATAVAAQTRKGDFEGEQVGQPPAGFTFGHTAKLGAPGKWLVQEEDGGRFLAQLEADRTRNRCPVAVITDVTAKDIDLSVRFKPIWGRVDQAGGLVWRYQDEDNYYIVRANALEDNVVLYKVQNGRRMELPLKGEGAAPCCGRPRPIPSSRYGGPSRRRVHLVPPEERRLAVVFQDLALWPHLNVRGNLSFGLAARGVPHGEAESRITVILDRLRLADKASRYPGQLSGGERQRVAIARALVLEPRAVLLDEPLSNLDVTLKRELLSLFRSLFRERHSTAIYVTHDLREAASLGDLIAVMEAGRLAQVGTLHELREKPASPFVRGFVEELDWQPPAHA